MRARQNHGPARPAGIGIPTSRAASAAVLLAAVLSLGGCDTVKGWFSKDKPPLPGARVSILANQRSLAANDDLKGKQIILPAPLPNDAWPQAGGYPNHAMHHMALSESITQAWRTGIGEGADKELRILGSPVVAKNHVYAMDSESRVVALDLKDGRRLWRTKLAPKTEEDDGHISGGLAYYRGRLYAGTGFGQVIAIDAETGKVLWRAPVPGAVRAAPTAWRGQVYAVTLDNRTFAINADTGQPVWDHSGITESAALLGSASPAVDGDVIVVPYSSGELVALRTENGRLLWSDSLASVKRTDIVSALSHIRGRPIIDRGLVIAVSHSGIMAAYDLRSGRRVWEKDVGSVESPWVAGNYIYVLTTDSEAAAINRDTGQVYWVTPLPRFVDPDDREKPIVWTGPLLASDRLIIAGSHGKAWALSPYSGKFIGEVKLPDGVSVPPVIADGQVVFLTDDADIITYR
ncbi:MAG: PQQ-binding-like beta-propeller repeat protein [Rhodospirillaceae bacterium]